jgi:hypothetical protein
LQAGSIRSTTILEVMMKALFSKVLAIASVAILCAAPAHAQATRTWVSGVGDDANPCSRTAPCKTFAGAMPKTAAGGEINALDPGGFGAVTITKSISIISEIEAGVAASGTTGIIVNVADTDKVLIQGLDIDGLGTGVNGIQIIGGGKTTILKCSIRNFTGNGINLVGTANARAVIDDTVLLNNAGGLNILGVSGAFNFAFLKNSLLDSNTSFATQTAGPSQLVLLGTTLIGSPSSILATGGATVTSYGNNLIRNAGVPTQTLTLQ